MASPEQDDMSGFEQNSPSYQPLDNTDVIDPFDFLAALWAEAYVKGEFLTALWAEAYVKGERGF